MRSFPHKFHGCFVFSTIDYKKMFHTSRYTTESANRMGFLLPDGRTARYRGMVMGVSNSPGIANSQHADSVLTPWLNEHRTDTVTTGTDITQRHEADFYVDNDTLGTRIDLTLLDPTAARRDAVARHVTALISLVSRVVDAGYCFGPTNCEVLRTESRTLGIIFDGTTTRIDPKRIEGFGDLTVRHPVSKDYVFAAFSSSTSVSSRRCSTTRLHFNTNVTFDASRTSSSQANVQDNLYQRSGLRRMTRPFTGAATPWSRPCRSTRLTPASPST